VALLPPITFQGTYLHPRTGASFPYAGTCVVVIDRMGRESMHVRGSIRKGNREAPLVVLGHVDRHNSFVGREVEAVNDCLARRFADDNDFFAPTAPAELEAA